LVAALNGGTGAPQAGKEILPENLNMENPKMHFVLREFNQVSEFRVFAFEGVSADWSRRAFTVRANLTLSRLYGIRLQELPLLCRAVLERREEAEQERAFTLTEDDMRVYADAATARAEAAKQKRPPRPPANPSAGAAWRVPPR
jgi:hypothetical protein